MKAYLLTYSDATTPQYVQSMLSATRAVSTWVAPFPYAVIVISELALGELTAVLETHLAGTWFLLAELTPTSCNGLLPKQFWAYVQDPFKASSEKTLRQLYFRSLMQPQDQKRSA